MCDHYYLKLVTWISNTVPNVNCPVFSVIESPCQDLKAPLNGAKACETWLAGLMCTVHCNEGYGFVNFPHPVYYCSPTTGEWFHARANKGKTPSLPDCSSEMHCSQTWWHKFRLIQTGFLLLLFFFFVWLPVVKRRASEPPTTPL